MLQVHLGRSANCSSVGSVVDFLFLSAVAGSAVLAAVTVALAGGEGGRARDDDARGNDDDHDNGHGNAEQGGGRRVDERDDER